MNHCTLPWGQDPTWPEQISGGSSSGCQQPVPWKATAKNLYAYRKITHPFTEWELIPDVSIFTKSLWRMWCWLLMKERGQDKPPKPWDFGLVVSWFCGGFFDSHSATSNITALYFRKFNIGRRRKSKLIMLFHMIVKKGLAFCCPANKLPQNIPWPWQRKEASIWEM